MKTRLAILFAVLASLSSHAYAQTNNNAEEKEETPWFQIELIIFEYANLNNTDSEVWPNEPGSPEFAGTVDLIPSAVLEEYQQLNEPQAIAAIEAPANPEQITAPTESALTLPAATSAPEPAEIAPIAEADTLQAESNKEIDTEIAQEETPFVLLDDEGLMLNRAKEDLAKHPAYHVLHHIAWRQPVLPASESVGIHIHSNMENGEFLLEKRRQQLADEQAKQHAANETNDESVITNDTLETMALTDGTVTMGITLNQPIVSMLPDQEATAMADEITADTTATPVPQRLPLEGVIRVSLSRFLHLSADLTLTREIELPATPSIFTTNTEETETDLILVREDHAEPQASPPIISTSLGDIAFHQVMVQKPYRLIESRRMRSKETHYIDHPAFGIVALITPYERPHPDEKQETPIENIMIGVSQ